jgi:hypothetical protein
MRGDAAAILERKEPLRRAALSNKADKTAFYLVAGIGFEPMTFRL